MTILGNVMKKHGFPLLKMFRIVIHNIMLHWFFHVFLIAHVKTLQETFDKIVIHRQQRGYFHFFFNIFTKGSIFVSKIIENIENMLFVAYNWEFYEWFDPSGELVGRPNQDFCIIKGENLCVTGPSETMCNFHP